MDINIKINNIVQRFNDTPGALLPVLHAIQSEYGYIPNAAVAEITRVLNLSRAEIHGVISFYPDFRNQPRGRHLVQICRAEACQSMGARSLEAHAKKKLGVDFGETTADGAVTLEPVYCLGNCACSPSVRINNGIYARVDASRFDELIAGLSTSPTPTPTTGPTKSTVAGENN